MQFLIFIFLFLSNSLWAQGLSNDGVQISEVVSFNPFSLPVYISPDGKLSVFGGKSEQLVYIPLVQGYWGSVKMSYSKPIKRDFVDFQSVDPSQNWIEVKRRRIEVGAGLSSLIQSTFFLGLVEFKGATQSFISTKKFKDDPSRPLKLPRFLKEVEDWNVQDTGVYQTYGGINAYAGVTAPGAGLALQASFGLQNQFVVEIIKKSTHELQITIDEEDLKRRQLMVGPFFSRGTFSRFNTNRISISFKFDLKNESHHSLYEELIAGNVKKVQESLSSDSQRIVFKVDQSSFYFGIPTIVGRILGRGHYEINDDDVESEIDFIAARNRGVLLPLRNHQDFAYHTDSDLLLFWSSEMKRANLKDLEKRFLNRGRALGIKAFSAYMTPTEKIGTVHSQILLNFTREEIEKIKRVDMTVLKNKLLEHCEYLKLSCRKKNHLNQMMKKMDFIRKNNWDKMRSEVAKLFLKEPAIIHSIVGLLNLEKDGYFRLFSDKYQSFEGTSPIESSAIP